jgi:hypothetical protein
MISVHKGQLTCFIPAIRPSPEFIAIPATGENIIASMITPMEKFPTYGLI